MSTQGSAGLDERIADWVDERMTPRERDRFEAELRVNARLRAQAESYQRMVRQVRALGSAPTESVDVSGRVLAALQRPQEAAAPIRSDRPSKPALIASALVAAAALVLVSVLSQWQPAATRSDLAQKPTDAKPVAAKTSAIVEDSGRQQVAAAGDAAPRPDGAAGGLDVPSGPPSSVVPQITLLPRLFAVPPVAAGGGPGASGGLGTTPGAPVAAPSADVGAGGGGGGESLQKRSGSLGAGNADFAWQALALGLHVERLTGVPLAAGRSEGVVETMNSATAYLVQGTKAAMDAFLRRLAEVSLARGLDVRNGEADAQSVASMVPAAPAEAAKREKDTAQFADKQKSANAATDADARVRLVVVVPAPRKS